MPRLFQRRPADLFFVVVEHLFRRRELRFVQVFRGADFAEKIFEVFALGETGELRGVFEAHVEQAANPGFS
jgi:hypothetical protein